MTAVDRPPTASVLTLTLTFGPSSSVAGSGPCGKVGNADSSRFPLFHQGGSPFFFGSFFFVEKCRFPRVFRRFARSATSALAACALLCGLGAVAVDVELEDHRVVHD